MKKMFVLLFAMLMCFSVNAKKLKLTSDNTVVLRSSFSSASVTSLKQDLIKLDSTLKSGYPIYLVLYTPGGSIQAGLELFEFINGLNRPVHTVTIFAASMGFQAVQHLGKRYILRYGVLMSHNAAGGARGEFNGAGKGQIASRLGLWYRRVGMMDTHTVNRTNGKQTLKSYQSAYSPELWLNGPEAVKNGYADEVVTASCDTSLTSVTTNQIFSNGFYKISATFSGCPLITSPVGMSAQLLTNKGYMSLNEFLEKNGKFGKSCKDKKTKISKGWGEGYEVVESELCAYDKSLNVDFLMDKVKEKENFLNRDLKHYIERSY